MPKKRSNNVCLTRLINLSVKYIKSFALNGPQAVLPEDLQINGSFTESLEDRLKLLLSGLPAASNDVFLVDFKDIVELSEIGPAAKAEMLKSVQDDLQSIADANHKRLLMERGLPIVPEEKTADAEEATAASIELKEEGTSAATASKKRKATELAAMRALMKLLQSRQRKSRKLREKSKKQAPWCALLILGGVGFLTLASVLTALFCKDADESMAVVKNGEVNMANALCMAGTTFFGAFGLMAKQIGDVFFSSPPAKLQPVCNQFEFTENGVHFKLFPSNDELDDLVEEYNAVGLMIKKTRDMNRQRIDELISSGPKAEKSKGIFGLLSHLNKVAHDGDAAVPLKKEIKKIDEAMIAAQKQTYKKLVPLITRCEKLLAHKVNNPVIYAEIILSLASIYVQVYQFEDKEDALAKVLELNKLYEAFKPKATSVYENCGLKLSSAEVTPFRAYESKAYMESRKRFESLEQRLDLLFNNLDVYEPNVLSR